MYGIVINCYIRPFWNSKHFILHGSLFCEDEPGYFKRNCSSCIRLRLFCAVLIRSKLNQHNIQLYKSQSSCSAMNEEIFLLSDLGYLRRCLHQNHFVILVIMKLNPFWGPWYSKLSRQVIHAQWGALSAICREERVKSHQCFGPYDSWSCPPYMTHICIKQIKMIP